jgi:hypothetical protein
MPLPPVVLKPGDRERVDTGVAHSFCNPTGAVARVLNVDAPGGSKRVLRALVPAIGERPADETVTGRVAAEPGMIALA